MNEQENGKYDLNYAARVHQFFEQFKSGVDPCGRALSLVVV